MKNERSTPHNFKELIISFLSGDITLREREEEDLRNWLNDSRENKEEFIKMMVPWMASSQSGKNTAFDFKKALSSLNRKIDLHENNKYRPRFYRFKQFARIAAIFILFSFIGSLITYFTLNNKRPQVKKEGMICVYASKGSKAMTVLPDGTQVWLNAGSNLSYDIGTYGQKKREVTRQHCCQN